MEIDGRKVRVERRMTGFMRKMGSACGRGPAETLGKAPERVLGLLSGLPWRAFRSAEQLEDLLRLLVCESQDGCSGGDEDLRPCEFARFGGEVCVADA